MANMKKFWKTLFRGCELLLLGALSIEGFVGAGMLFAIIHKDSGWSAILDLCLAVASLAVGVVFMYMLGDIGNEAVEHSEENKENA